MRSLAVLGKFVTPAAAVLGPAIAWAQAGTVTAPPSTSASDSSAGTWTLVAVLGGLIVLVTIGVKLYDLKRKREAEAVHLQAQVSDALLREPGLTGAPVTPTAHVPLWSGTPAVIELTGQVESPIARDVALRVVESEAARIRPDVRVEDHLGVRAA